MAVYFNEEIKMLKEFGYMDIYKRCVRVFNKRLFHNPEGIHGYSHMRRVLIHVLSLARALNLKEDNTRVLCLAAMYHDIGRDHDWEDTVHGDKGWNKVQALRLLEQSGIDLDMAEPLTDSDKLALEFCIRHHCRSDEVILAEKIKEIPAEEQDRITKLIKVFKDADGLDRVRLGDLNVAYLRTEVGKERVDFAEQLLRNFHLVERDETMDEEPVDMNMRHMLLLKENYMKEMQSADIEQMREDIKTKNPEYTTLYHGTTSAYLPSILEKGILPRKEVQINNWKHATESMEGFTYLTNKWHYMYAVNANMEYLIGLYGEKDYLEHLNETFPCYVEIRVPKEFLFVDEDFFLTKFMLQKFKTALKKKATVTFNWMECLAQYGTAAVLGPIPPEWIVSFTVLGDISVYDYILNHDKQYHKDFETWQSGKGKGKLKLKDLLAQEEKSDMNGTWWIKDLRGRTIGAIGLNPKTNKISIVPVAQVK